MEIKTKHLSFLLVCFFILTYLVPLGMRPLLRPDEFRYAEIPREMLASGDWTTPKIADAVYFEKTPFTYWTSAISFKVAGENAFALRLPSAIASGVSAWILFLLLKHARGRKEDDPVPALATGIYLASGLVFGVGTFAVTDMQLNAALMTTLGAFYMAWDSKKIKQRLPWLILAGIGAGTAFLIKGFLAFAVPVSAILPFLIWRKDWKSIFTLPWIPFATAVIIALPWSIAIHKAEPGFWNYFFFVEHIARFTSKTLDRDKEPFYYFIPVLLGGIMPPGLLWIAAWKGLTKKFLSEKINQFMICASVMPFILFSASSCKLGTYILPCFAPLAALLGTALYDAFTAQQEKTEKALNYIYKYFGAALIIISAAATGAPLFIKALQGANFSYYAACAMLAAWGSALAFTKEIRLRTAVFLFGMTGGIIFGINGIPDRAYGDSALEPSIKALLEKSPLKEGDTILVDRNTLHAVPWTLKTTRVTILWRPGELKYAFETYPERYKGRWIKNESGAPEALKDKEKNSRVFFFVRNLKKYPIKENWDEYEIYEHNGLYMVRF